jgi:hypothetical protein
MEGAVCAGIVERDSERLLAAAGNGALPGVATTAIAVAARAAADLDGADLDGAPGVHAAEVDDLMVTSAAYFHVLRQVDVPGGEPVLVYVRLRRGHADPATCRRELGSAQLREAVVRACGAGQPARTPQPLPARRLSAPPRPLRVAPPINPAPINPTPINPTPINPTPITAAPGNPPPPRERHTAARTHSAPVNPARSAAWLDPVGSPWWAADPAGPGSAHGEAADRSGPATVSPLPAPRRPLAPSTSLRPAMTSIGLSAIDAHSGTGEGDDAAPHARGAAPAATPVAATDGSLPTRTPSPPPLPPTPSARSAGSGRSLGMLAAAAMPAARPATAAARPTTAEPMPAAPLRRGAPVNPAAPHARAPSPRPPAPNLTARVPATDEPGRHDRSPVHDGPVPLPRRVRGAQLVGPPTSAEAAPDPGDYDDDDADDAAATPSVLRQSWRHDTPTLRRLLDGLRRLG